MTTAAILLFLLAGLCLLFGLVLLTALGSGQDTDVVLRTLLALGLAVAFFAAAVLVLRLKRLGRVLALAASAAMAVFTMVNLINTAPGRGAGGLLVSGFIGIGLPLIVLVFLGLEGRAFRSVSRSSPDAATEN